MNKGRTQRSGGFFQKQARLYAIKRVNNYVMTFQQFAGIFVIQKNIKSLNRKIGADTEEPFLCLPRFTFTQICFQSVELPVQV